MVTNFFATKIIVLKFTSSKKESVGIFKTFSNAHVVCDFSKSCLISAYTKLFSNDSYLLLISLKSLNILSSLSQNCLTGTFTFCVREFIKPSCS